MDISIIGRDKGLGYTSAFSLTKQWMSSKSLENPGSLTRRCFLDKLN